MIVCRSDIGVNSTLNVFRISGKDRTTNFIVIFRKLVIYFPVYSFMMIKD